MPKPTKIIKKLRLWLETRFKDGKFTDKGDLLEHGNQEDFTDCGILCANTAAHEIFNDPVWTVSNKKTQRAQWFVTLIKKNIDEVSTINSA